MSDDPALTARPETSLNARPEPRSGVAPIKAEYLLNPTPTVESASISSLNNLSEPNDDLAETSTSHATSNRSGAHPPDARDAKRRKFDKKAHKGQNKARSFPVINESSIKICRSWEVTGVCGRGEGCRFGHDWKGYFEVKEGDVHYERGMGFDVHGKGEGEGAERFVVWKKGVERGEEGDLVGGKVDMGTECVEFRERGWCSFGWRCRFLGGHVRRVGDKGVVEKVGEGLGVIEGVEERDRFAGWELVGKRIEEDGKWKNLETNWPRDGLLDELKRSQYKYPFSEKYLDLIEPDKPHRLYRNTNPQKTRVEIPAPLILDEEEAMNEEVAVEVMVEERKGVIDGEVEASEVPLRPEEKKRLNWEHGLYLAPLTTVGNLPFRRLCRTYGATITISEMALAQPLINGEQNEWALVRRHESEKMFGIQLAGGYANRMVPCAEMIRREIGSSGVDFVDVNLGCPIDLVFNQGAGSALMDSPGRLGKILVGMNRALGDIPLTVKFRTGVANGKPNAHKLIPRFVNEWGASALTLHGRSRQQRYSKLADWAYIKECADTLRETMADAGLPAVPIFGNGDCFSAMGYYEEKEKSGVDGIMIARGALIKPWIFTEIAERREWDISATERLDGIRKYAEFGLSHWGSDTQGVSKTRRFLCEALSFQHRYIPIGLLERLPPMLNERPPAYKGRNELETLLSSPFAGDWVKISEMFLGKVGEKSGWEFVPKHKSNAYGGEEAQG